MTAIPKKKHGMCSEHLEHLLDEAINGSEAAFREIVFAEHRRVRVYLAKYVFCSAEIDDIAQEVFMAAYENLAKFKRQSKFSTWLLGIARNKALQYLRVEIKRRQNNQRYLDATILNQRLTALQTDNSDFEQSRIFALRECFQSLPTHARQLIETYYYDHSGSAEIASREQPSEGAIRMKLFRIRKKLGECVSMRLKNV